MKVQVLVLCTLAAALFAAEEKKTIPTEKLGEFNKVTIKLQNSQLRYLGTKNAYDEQKKKFEKQAEAELEKLGTEVEKLQQEFVKMVDALRKDSGVAANCVPDESGSWKCPEPPPGK